MTPAVSVSCTPEGRGYRCEVAVEDRGSSSRHVIRVRGDDFARWAEGRAPEDLVLDSFRFLLEREPKESIMKEFDLSVIKRYFPDYDGAKRTRPSVP